jgi:hypothetical protein
MSKSTETVAALQSLAHCHVAAGRLLKGKELLQHALGRLADGDPLRDVVTLELSILDQRIPRVTLRSIAGMGNVIVRDGARLLPATALGKPLEMDPGKHRFTARAAGRETTTILVEVAEGRNQEVVLPAGAEIWSPSVVQAPAAAMAASPADTNPGDHDWKHVVGWVAGGLGIAGIGLGASTGLANQPKKSTADRKCDNPATCMDGRYAGPHGSPSLAAVSATGWVIGAAGLSAAAFLLLSNDHKTGKQTMLAADMFRGGAGLHVSRRF